MSVQHPSPWVVAQCVHLPAHGTLLDLACGHGRHARFLAARGHAVLAVDRDPDCIAALAGVSGVDARCADLENDPWPYPGQQFSGIVVTRYLHRPLWPLLLAALAPGGILLYETFMQGQAQYGRPRRAEFLLQSQELLNRCRAAGMTVLAYAEGPEIGQLPNGATGVLAVSQKICARAATPVAAQNPT